MHPRLPVSLCPSVAWLIGLALIFVGGVASADPAHVRVPEASVHQAPLVDAPVIAVLAVGAPITTSPEPEAGWFRARLADGRVGYIAEGAVARTMPVAPAQTVLRQPPPPARGTPTPVYVEGTADLLVLVEEDPQLLRRAESLDSRDTWAEVVRWLSVTGGTALAAAGALTDSCRTEGFTECQPSWMVIGVGAALSALGVGASYAIQPSDSDLKRVISHWNARHPDRAYRIVR